MAMSRSRGARSVTSRPPMRISPEVASSRPPTMRRTVVLPEPDGPTSTRTSPSATSRSSEETATAPPGNALVTPDRTIAATALAPHPRRPATTPRAPARSVTTRYPAPADGSETPPFASDPGARRAVARPLLPVGGGAADPSGHHHAPDRAAGGDDDHHGRAAVQVQAVGRARRPQRAPPRPGSQGAGGPPLGAGGAPSGDGCGRTRSE